MNIIRETKWALLELFPGQKATEAEAEATAWKNVLIAEAEAQAAAEAKAATAARKAAAAEGEEVAEVAPEPVDTASLAPYNPETHDLPLSEIPKGGRTDGVLVTDHKVRGAHLDVQGSPGQMVEVARMLDAAGFSLESISGVDWIKEGQMEVVYDYNRTDGRFCRVAARVRVPRSAPAVPTISGIFSGANWHERETHEFFGIKFEGHPYLVPLLLPEDADFHPLQKDFTP